LGPLDAAGFAERSGGTDALAILRSQEGLMITDLSTPGMNGLTLIKEAQERCPILPTILLLGYAEGRRGTGERWSSHERIPVDAQADNRRGI